jgi:hypothetical protein
MIGSGWGSIRRVSVMALGVACIVGDIGLAPAIEATSAGARSPIPRTAGSPAPGVPAVAIRRPSVGPTTAPPPAAPLPYRLTAYEIRELAPDDLPYAETRIPSTGPPRLHDRDGLPIKIVDRQRHYSPSGLAQFGLRYEDAYRRTRDPAHLKIARKALGKLMDLGVEANGGVFISYRFDFAMHGIDNEVMRAPWYSAMAQGLALSLAIRLHRDTEEAGFRADADRLFASFLTLGRGSDPWVTYVDDGFLWLEEYPEPTTPSDHTANGFNFAVFGIYDYYQATRDASALQVLRASLTTMRHHVADFRVPGGLSRYCLRHGRPQIKYHRVLIWQLRFLAAMSGDPYFASMSRNLAADHP